MDAQQIVSLSIAIIVFFVFATFFGLFFTIQQQTVGVVQRFGRFVRLARAGLNLKIPFIESVEVDFTVQIIVKRNDVPKRKHLKKLSLCFISSIVCN